MLRRIEPDEPALERAGPSGVAPRRSDAVTPPQLGVDAERDLLPHGHPKWARDGVSVSARARDLLARVRPIALRVLHFWDHHARSILVAGRRVDVDSAGCYRLE